MTNFHDEIRKNQFKSFVLVVLFALLIILIGFVIGEYFLNNYIFGMITAFIIAVIYSLIAYNSGDSMILSATKAKEVTREKDPYLMNIVEGLAIAAQLPVPKVYIIEEESINAFATGKNSKKASIAVTSGARKRLSKLELEGVIAHELSHIKNYDIKVMMLTAVLFGVAVLLSDMIFRSFLWAPRQRQEGRGNAIILLIAVALAILAPIIAQVIKLAISRKREFLADATGAKLTRYPDGLADALEKIKNDHDTVVDTANRGVSHLFIENPLRHKESWTSKIFSTHPSIDLRIKKLRDM